MAYPPNMTALQADRAAQCARLPGLRAALDALMTGQARNMVKDGDRETTRHPGNVKELRAEIRKLEAMCFGCPGAVQAGPHVPHGFGPFRRY